MGFKRKMSEFADEKFLDFVVKNIVDNPSEVKIKRVVDEMGVLLSLQVSPKDMGQVVGREGNTAKAIRSLLRIVGIKHNARINLKIEEPEGGRMSGTMAPAGQTASQAEPDAAPRAPRMGAMDKVIEDIKGM